MCPWASFRVNEVISIYRLIFLGILILLFRRVPVVFAMHWKIWQIEEKQQALFVGFFGPIGVSAVFYLYVSLQFLREVTVDGEIREDAARLIDVFTAVIWFLAICSIVSELCTNHILSHLLILPKVVHGLSVPIGKLGYHLPRTFSSAVGSRSMSMDPEDPEEPAPPFRVRDRIQHLESTRQDRNKPVRDQPARPIFRIGGSVIRSAPPEDGSTEAANPAAKGTTAEENSPDTNTASLEGSKKE